MNKITAYPRNIMVVAFEDCQVLDIAGPIEAFHKAEFVQDNGDRNLAYNLTLVAEKTGPLKTSGPLSLVADKSYLSLSDEELDEIDTLLISGGNGSHRALREQQFIDFIIRVSKRARRVVSICTGAFVLAEAGLLNNRRVTTHWESAKLLAARYPEVSVNADAIYINDGKFWTSAGVTAGIDLSLALIEEDLGQEMSLAIARQLVVYMMRPGGQTQFSTQLKYHRPSQSRLADLFDWIEQNPASDLSITALAERCAMSERHFTRRFTEEAGISPAKFVEHCRLGHARRLLEQSDKALECISYDCGYGSAEILRRSFQRHLHLSPSEYRQRFCTTRCHPPLSTQTT